MSHEPPAPGPQLPRRTFPQDPSCTMPGAAPDPSQWVDMRWQGALGWAIATGFSVYITVGLVVLTVVTAVSSGGVWDTVFMLLLTLVFVLLSRILVRMTPRYATRQGLLADDTGITLMQEPKWWFPGCMAHVPWSQVSGMSQDVIVFHGQSGRKTQHVIDIDLYGPDRDMELPGWAALDDSKIRIQPSKAKHAAAVGVLRRPRPDLFPG